MNIISKRPPSGNTREHFDWVWIDKAFFERHPDQKSYRRKVVRDEVPSSLRTRRVRAVHVYRITDGIFLRGFIDAHGHKVGNSLSIDDRKCSTAAGRRVAQICQIVFDAFLSVE